MVDVIVAVIDLDEAVSAISGDCRANGPTIVVLLVEEDLDKVILVLLKLLIVTEHSVVGFSADAVLSTR